MSTGDEFSIELHYVYKLLLTVEFSIELHFVYKLLLTVEFCIEWHSVYKLLLTVWSGLVGAFTKTAPLMLWSDIARPTPSRRRVTTTVAAFQAHSICLWRGCIQQSQEE
jgi:hypothetical protein